jgi:hypothetical protein
MSKYSGIIKAKSSVNKESSKAVSTALQKDVITESKTVSLTIKVPENLRRHWQSESKKMGSNISADIKQALTKKYGTPE